MLDPNFNPYDTLEEVQKQLKQCSNNIMQLATALNARGELLQQIIDQLNQQTTAINEHDRMIYEMHDRLRLLEVARQYENTTKNNNQHSPTFDHDKDSNASGQDSGIKVQ